MSKTVMGILGIFIVMPIWFYLQYQVLVRINASELMWFLFWVYIPVSLLVGILSKITETKG